MMYSRSLLSSEALIDHSGVFCDTEIGDGIRIPRGGSITLAANGRMKCWFSTSCEELHLHLLNKGWRGEEFYLVRTPRILARKLKISF